MVVDIRLCEYCGEVLPDLFSECAQCAPHTTEDHTPFPCLPGYEVLQVLGKGGMGVVYLAEEKALGRKVAVKVVSEAFAQTSGAMARFRREARAMATVEHPNIVRIYSLGDIGSTTYFAMEYIEGELLADRIRRLSRLSLPESLQILKQVVQALNAAWARKIVHRDIKPSNILLDQAHNAHVADFGLAKPIDMKEETLSGEGAVLGTPHYVSPEQALGHAVDFRSDIYSLGIVFYEMLTGEKPFHGTTPFAIVNQQLNTPLPALNSTRSDVPQSVCALLECMTEKAPLKRPASYDALLKRIDSILANSAARAPDVSCARTLEELPHKTASKPWAILAGAILLTALISFFVWKKSAPPASEPPALAEPEPELTVAVAPFYGPDEESAKEGRVMAALIEKAISERLGKEVKVVGIDQTRESVHDAAAARALGVKWHSTLVLWGQAFAVRTETEIQPYFTIVPRRPGQQEISWQTTLKDEDPFRGLSEHAVASLVMQAEAPNQIELRKTSAAGISEMVQLMAGMHALYVQENAQKALSILEKLPRSPDSLHGRARALLRLGKKQEAVQLLQEAVQIDPQHGESFALLGDMSMEAGNLTDAITEYRTAMNTDRFLQTTRGFFFHDQFYASEVFSSEKYTGGQQLETSYLLRIDPDTGKVMERFHLPGAAKSFLVKREGIRIVYEDETGNTREVEFESGKSGDLLPDEDPVLRIQSIQSGLALAANFMNDLEARQYVPGARFASQPESLYKDAPATLRELEEALIAARDRDPTQPWHLFLLGEVLWAQERKKEAGDAWGALLNGAFPAAPYYDFAYMAGLFERLGQRNWADRAYEAAIKHNGKTSNSPEFSTLMGRLVNSNFIRGAAWASQKGIDLERQHLWLERARTLSGVCLQGDDFAAAAWSRYFDKANKAQAAATEKTIQAEAQSHPLNIMTVCAHLDYAYYLLLAATLSFPLLLCLVLIRSFRECAPTAMTGTLQGLAPVACVLAALLGGSLLWKQHREQLMVMAALLLLFFVLLRSSRITFSSLIGSIPLNGRIALVTGFVVLLITLSTCVVLNHRLSSTLNRSLQTSDFDVVAPLSTQPSLPGEDNWNVWLKRVWTPGNSLNLFPSETDEAVEENPDDYASFFFQASMLLILALLISFVWIKPAVSPTATGVRKPHSKLSRSLSYIVPGYFDLNCRSFFFGYFILILFTFALVSLAGQVLIPHTFPVPGIVTLFQMPNYFHWVPFPTPPGLNEMQAIVSYHYWTIFFAYSGAQTFWLCVCAATLTSLLYHAFLVPLVRRNHADAFAEH